MKREMCIIISILYPKFFHENVIYCQVQKILTFMVINKKQIYVKTFKKYLLNLRIQSRFGLHVDEHVVVNV